jgi:hypothetical protein
MLYRARDEQVTWRGIAMTVQEVIDELQKVEDKTKQVFCYTGNSKAATESLVVSEEEPPYERRVVIMG